MMSILLKSARIGAAAVLPAVLVFALASDDLGGYNADWVDYLVPIALVAVIAVGWLDSLPAVILTAFYSGLIVAVAASIERDDRPIPLCDSLMDFGCKLDASPTAGLLAATWVLVGGGAGALIAVRRRKRSASN